MIKVKRIPSEPQVIHDGDYKDRALWYTIYKGDYKIFAGRPPAFWHVAYRTQTSPPNIKVRYMHLVTVESKHRAMLLQYNVLTKGYYDKG